jgi:hypothetical protein
VFYAELNELLTRELAADGYSGVEVRVTPLRTEIIIRATRTQNVLGTLLGVRERGVVGVGQGLPSTGGVDGSDVSRPSRRPGAA